MTGNKGNYYIAVDFDGTLVEHRFPRIGLIRDWVVKTIKRRKEHLRREGYTPYIILWTCRPGEFFKQAKEFCIENKLPIDFYNENPLVEFETSNKIFAHEYWDDRAISVTTMGKGILFPEGMDY